MLGAEANVAIIIGALFVIPAQCVAARFRGLSVEPDAREKPPGGLDAQGLPLGLHLIGRELDEQGVLNAALAIEERAGFSARAEKWW